MDSSLGISGGSRTVPQRGAALPFFDQEDCMNRTGTRVAGLSRWMVLMAMVAGIAGVAPALFAATNTITLQVREAGTNTAITTYKYIINVDNTGTTTQRPNPTTGAPPVACTPADPGYPDSCQWVSIAGAASNSPIYAQGDQTDFGTGITFPAKCTAAAPCRYLISVLADGHKLDGAHFTVPLPNPVNGANVVVQLQPFPLPDATIQAAVFEDVSPVNGAPDLPAEHGLAGFVGHIADYIGEVTTDVYGDPLCGGPGQCVSKCYVVDNGIDIGTVAPIDSYGRCPTDPAGLTMIEGGAVPATAAIEGKLKIPNVGPNRYALSIVPPDGSNWIQTTTLEGNHDWDAWVMEGATGLDTEFVVAGEPFPAIIFGFVRPTNLLSGTGAGGQIKGVVDAFKVYVPPRGGLISYEPLVGGKIDKPIEKPWIALSDLQFGDTAVWIGHGDANGAFTIPSVPDGNYTLTWWDEPQDYILNLMNVTVANGEVVDLGVLPLNGWWTQLEGYVFNDLNRNGIRDAGEPGLANFPVAMRKRENSLMDRGAVTVTTDATGYYYMENAYPITQWLVMEAYNDLYYTTGVTYQADNQPAPTTILGAGVDVSVLPIIGLGGRLDWGVHNYTPPGGTPGVDPDNGGIVGTVSYDTTRNEIDPRFAAVEDWQPGIPNLNVNLYAPVDCPVDGSAPCDATGRYRLDTDGSFLKGQLLNTYVTETWQRPGANGNANGDGACVSRDVNGDPLAYPADQQVTNSTTDCLEGPLMGVQFQAGFSTVDGNYGFGGGCFGPGGAIGPETCADESDPTPLTVGDYLVEVEIPNDATGRPMYKVTKEEDINIANGDQFVPQIPPPECAGPLHTVDVMGQGTDGYPANTTFIPGVTVRASTPVDNATFFTELGGSYYEGQPKPLCSTKLVRVSAGRSVAPTFNLFTDVPIPGRFWGLIVDDLNFSSDPRSLLYGEKAGVPFAPVGIYDYTNRLVYTTESDYNGLWDVLLPSSNRINCPTPSGVCANLYRFVGNDPGIPGRLNANFKPQFRTIAAEFEAIPGLLVPADLAPTQVGLTAQLPGGQFNQVSCAVNNPDPTVPPTKPELFRVSRPYVTSGSASNRTFTITGQGFGTTQGTGRAVLGTTALTVNSWSDRQISVTVPSGLAEGPWQLKITASNGQSTINGLTIHFRKGAYTPNLFEVGPGKPYATIQSAIDAVATHAANYKALVVVYPGVPDLTNPRVNPRGAYYENLILNRPMKLQGVGPGGVYPNGTVVPGSIIDGSAFGGDTALADAWRAKVAGLTWVGNQTVSEGEVIFVLAETTGDFTSGGRGNPGNPHFASIDGFDLRGGDQQGQANIITQGGAIFVNAYVQYLQITNNVIEGNSGSYGTVRIGTPDLPAPNTSQHNENLRIANNRIIHNAGTNLAGGIALFAGADNYEVAGNDLCGNFSAEYGGGMTAYGYSPNGAVHDNRVYFNESYDEGGGILIAGELPANPLSLSPGSGPVNVYNNLIQNNMANDDGGGLRFLMAGNFPINVVNNMIVNNISTHEGGGIGLNDAPDVRIFNNTIMNNITTATAVTSNGFPAPAGLSTSANSFELQQTLPSGSPTFSNPLLFNNIFWDNRAGTRGLGTVTGLSDADVYHWDLGVADGTGMLSPTNSILQVATGTVLDGSNQVGVDPQVVLPYSTGVTFAAWRNNPAFVDAIMIVNDLPPNLLGNYHLAAGSPAIDLGAAVKSGVNAPTFDFDNQPRTGNPDSGADEYVP